jgi:aspartate aminotransferase
VVGPDDPCIFFRQVPLYAGLAARLRGGSPHHPFRKGLAEELVSWTRINGLATPTPLMQRAVPRLLYLRYSQEWLLKWRRFIDELSARGYNVVPPYATMLLYVRTPSPYDDFEFVQKLATAGLLVLPAPVFHHRGYFRLSLTGSEPMLERALSILGRFAP